MGAIAEISLINLNMRSNDKENKEDNNINWVCNNGDSVMYTTIKEISCSSTDTANAVMNI
jgi:hypothetical protein